MTEQADEKVTEKDAPEDETDDGSHDGSIENHKDDGPRQESQSEKGEPTEEDGSVDDSVAGDDGDDDETDANQEEKEGGEKTEDDDQPDGPTLQVSVDDPPDVEADGDNDDVDDQAGPTLQFTFQQTTDDIIPEQESGDEKPTANNASKKRPRKSEEDKEEVYELLNTHVEYEETDPQTIADKKTADEHKPESALEIALTRLLAGKEGHVTKLTSEIKKLKGFISKRKQTYKRKRKDEGAPTRALSAYNIFVQDRFAALAKKNSAALQSTDTNAQLERVPPANLVASTGGVWKMLSEEEKDKYRVRAKSDRKRYDEQMAKYQPPDKAGNRKRNKTGYNMFFSAHVLRLKQSELGVPSERGSVARLVGTAWKQLNAEEKQYYEREADKHNGMNPVDKGGDDDEKEGDGNGKETTAAQQQQAAAQAAAQQAAQAQQAAAAVQVQDPYAAHAAAQYGGHDISSTAGYAHAMHQAAAQQHDPRVAAAHHGYYYAQPHAAHAYHYDYSGHHQQQQAQAQQQQAQQQAQQQQQQPHGRASRGQYQYGQQPHGYYDK